MLAVRMPMNASALEPRLVGVTGFMSGEVFSLAGSAVTFGRDPDNTICSGDPALSRRHCVFRSVDGRWAVEDLGSSNGTFVNGVQIRTHQLTAGDRIAVGRCVLVFVTTAITASGGNAEILDADPPAVTATLALDDSAYLQPATDATASKVEQGLRGLVTLAATITAVRTEKDLHRELLRTLRQMVPAGEAALVLRHGDGDRDLEIVERAGSSSLLEVNRALIERVLTSRAGVLSHDVPAGGLEAAGREHDTPRSLLCVPIVFRTTPLGAIYLISAQHHAFDDDHLQLVTAVARMTALAIDNVRYLQAVERDAERMHADLQLRHNLVGDSPPMLKAYELLARAARSETTVLLTGETGTGKELAARAIHLNGSRARRPFIAVNCAALPEGLIESELFGYERGAFNNAVAQKKGRFELADSGTLFLDEVGELAPVVQSKLLRVLQEREFERLGGTRSVKVDIRLIAATNRHLGDEVRAGRFREDLFYRLRVLEIEMPPLRNRRGDIAKLARYFLAKYADKVGRAVSDITPDALECLQAHRWPGNVRELENVIERAVVVGSGSRVVPDDLPDDLIEADPSADGMRPSGSFRAAMINARRTAVVDALAAAGGSYVEAARLLGLHPNYLHRLARNLGLRSEE